MNKLAMYSLRMKQANTSYGTTVGTPEAPIDFRPGVYDSSRYYRHPLEGGLLGASLGNVIGSSLTGDLMHPKSLAIGAGLGALAGLANATYQNLESTRDAQNREWAHDPVTQELIRQFHANQQHYATPPTV